QADMMRGLSLVVDDKKKSEYSRLIDPIAKSFVAFPSGGDAHVDAPAAAPAAAAVESARPNQEPSPKPNDANQPPPSQAKVSVVTDIGIAIDDWTSKIIFSPDNKLIASAASTGITLWSVKSGRALRRFDYPAYVMGMAFSPSSRLLAASYKDGKIRIW